jgi:hypothetical protein
MPNLSKPAAGLRGSGSDQRRALIAPKLSKYRGCRKTRHSLWSPDLREKLQEIAEASPLWDKQVVNLAVTDFSEHAMHVSCLISARNAPQTFDLRCEVREKMIAYLQTEHSNALPRDRADLTAIIEGFRHTSSTNRTTNAETPILPPAEPLAPAGAPMGARPSTKAAFSFSALELHA